MPVDPNAHYASHQGHHPSWLALLDIINSCAPPLAPHPILEIGSFEISCVADALTSAHTQPVSLPSVLCTTASHGMVDSSSNNGSKDPPLVLKTDYDSDSLATLLRNSSDISPTPPTLNTSLGIHPNPPTLNMPPTLQPTSPTLSMPLGIQHTPPIPNTDPGIQNTPPTLNTPPGIQHTHQTLNTPPDTATGMYSPPMHSRLTMQLLRATQR